MDFADLVACEGDWVSASGRLIRDPTGYWFEPPMPTTLVLVTPRRVRPAWRGAVRVAGADFDHLADRFEDNGAVEGSASLTGIWSAGQLRAEHQASPQYGHPVLPCWDTPPCPAPPGGWPEPPRSRDGDENLHFDLGDLEDTGAAVAVNVFRPGRDRAVLVIAADPDAVETRLRPQLGALLCVVPSRWTKAELDAVRDHLHAQQEGSQRCPIPINGNCPWIATTLNAASAVRAKIRSSSWSPVPMWRFAMSVWTSASRSSRACEPGAPCRRGVRGGEPRVRDAAFSSSSWRTSLLSPGLNGLPRELGHGL
jgi:hypothetical protein